MKYIRKILVKVVVDFSVAVPFLLSNEKKVIQIQ